MAQSYDCRKRASLALRASSCNLDSSTVDGSTGRLKVVFDMCLRGLRRSGLTGLAKPEGKFAVPVPNSSSTDNDICLGQLGVAVLPFDSNANVAVSRALLMDASRGGERPSSEPRLDGAGEGVNDMAPRTRRVEFDNDSVDDGECCTSTGGL